MGNIVKELNGDHRLVSSVEGDSDVYYIVTPDWTRCTAWFDEVVDATPTHVTFKRNGHQYEAVYDSGRWHQKCLASGSDALYCAGIRCQRHPAYDTRLIGSLPTLDADAYGDWSPPLLVRLRLALRRFFNPKGS